MRYLGQLAEIIGPMGWALIGSAGVLALCYLTLVGCYIDHC